MIARKREDLADQREQFKRRTEDVINNTDIVELIEPYIEGGLRKQGQSYVGLCPFHADSNPSFSVTPSKGVYRCWSCDAGLNGSSGGDAITFIQRYHNKSFREACDHLAERQGISLTSSMPFTPAFRPPVLRHVAPEPVYLTTEKEQVEALRTAERAFFTAFELNDKAKAYLFEQRGISPELAKRYSIGYAPEGFDYLASHFQTYHGNKSLEEAGLIKATSENTDRFYDVFRGRVLFGVRNKAGETVGFGGRLLGEDSFTDKKTGKRVSAPKYLNSPESLLFKKGELLFGYYEAKSSITEQSQAIIVEGYMDVLGLANHGVTNAVACMGVAVSESHINDLIKDAKQIVICFDGDKAGKQGAARSLQGVLPAMTRDSEFEVRFLRLPDGLDPDDYIKQHGKPAFNALIDRSYTVGQFIDEAISEVDNEIKGDTSANDQSPYEKKLALFKRWIELSPLNSEIRKELSTKAFTLMKDNQRKNTPPSVDVPQALQTQTAPRVAPIPPPTLAFNRQETKENPSQFTKKGLPSFEQRIVNAVLDNVTLAIEKREALVEAANASSDDRYDNYVAWVRWYDDVLVVAKAQPEGNTPLTSDNDSKRLVSIIDHVIAAAINQGKLPDQSEITKEKDAEVNSSF